jgi:hypothetical protein
VQAIEMIAEVLRNVVPLIPLRTSAAPEGAAGSFEMASALELDRARPFVSGGRS